MVRWNASKVLVSSEAAVDVMRWPGRFMWWLEQINHNLSILKPGMSFREFNSKSWRIPEIYRACRYSVALHGVGLADEYPAVPLHLDFARSYEGQFEENMTVCVESLIGESGGRECMKLETQVVITPQGAVRLDSFPWEEI